MLIKIVDIQIERMERYLKDKHITLVLTDSAKAYFAEIGYDHVYGARPLKRAIQKEILNPLSTKLLAGTFKAGDVIEVDMEGDKPVFRNVLDKKKQQKVKK